MSWLLDTNVCIAFLNGRDPAVRERLLSLAPDDVSLCSVVKSELLYGARNSARVDENLKRLRDFFAPFESLPFGDEAAEHYGVLRAQLRRAGTPVGANDMMIAAIAMTADVTLITRDQDELGRIAGLRLEQW
jgi:tRNA(fMet)-specific endonuclease VapC